jgi:hypothetical protein
VEVTNEGTDQVTMLPLAEQLGKTYEVRPQDWLADNGCTSLENVDRMTERGCKVYAPVRESKAASRRKDSQAVRQWRERMDTEEAKTIYKLRGQTAEWVNARFRAQGLTHLLVRGLKKVRAVALLHAITHNFGRSMALST